MFPKNYFAPAYFAPTYFPPVTVTVYDPLVAGERQFGTGSSGALTPEKDMKTAQILREDDELLTIITVMLDENKWSN